MNNININELSTTSESDSEYLVDSRYCRPTVKCKRKALKKTIKLIHGRCVVVYRGTGDLLPIAAKDADRNCYSDFVFICYDPKRIKQGQDTLTMPRSRSAVQDSSSSNDNGDTDDDDENENNNHHIFQKHLFKQNSFSFQTKLNDNNNYDNTDSSMTTGKKPFVELGSAGKCFNDVDIDELFNTDKSLPSIVFFPSSSTKSKPNS